MPPKPNLTVLAFDTSAAHCAAALLCGGEITTRVEEMARGQGERLMGLLEDVLADAGLVWSDLDGIGVGVGPGNFTGIRIAVSAARGLALGLGKPAVGVSAFETTQRLSNCAQVAVPAPREQAYAMDFDKHNPPTITDADSLRAVAWSTDHSAEGHIGCLAQITAEGLLLPDSALKRPAPLYVRPADAAPPREKPPVILP